MANITINPTKSSNVEFELSVQGSDADNQVQVRFVIAEVFANSQVSIDCVNTGGNKWAATIPSDLLKSSSYPFAIEVIVNEYFFEPSSGTLSIVAAPTVNVDEGVAEVVKPVVTFMEVPTQDEKVVSSVQEGELTPDVDLMPFGTIQEAAPTPHKPKLIGLGDLEAAMLKQQRSQRVKDILSKT